MYCILVVEDEPLEREALVKQAQECIGEPCEILQAKTGPEALATALERRPQLIFMDINLPGMTGLEVVEALRAKGYRGEVIMITAYSLFAYAQSALRADVSDYLLKPVDGEELRRSVKKALAQVQSGETQAQKLNQLTSRIQNIAAYLQPMAIHGLLSGDDVEHTLRALYAWPADGALCAFMLRFCFPAKMDADALKCFYYDFYSFCQPDFTCIAAIESDAIYFALESLQPAAPARAELALWCIAGHMRRFTRQSGSDYTLRAGRLCNTYRELARPIAPAQAEAPGGDYLSLNALKRQSAGFSRIQQSKVLMRLKAGQTERAIGVCRGLMNNPDTRWGGLYRLLEALVAYKPDADALGAMRYVCASERPAAEAMGEWMHRNMPATAGAPRAGFLIETAQELLREEYGNPLLSQADLAERLGLSQAYFSRLFKKETGETFMACLSRIRLEHARTLLRAGEDSAAVAAACGYQSKKYFLDAFRQNFGCTVAQFLERGAEE